MRQHHPGVAWDQRDLHLLYDLQQHPVPERLALRRCWELDMQSKLEFEPMQLPSDLCKRYVWLQASSIGMALGVSRCPAAPFAHITKHAGPWVSSICAIYREFARCCSIIKLAIDLRQRSVCVCNGNYYWNTASSSCGELIELILFNF